MSDRASINFDRLAAVYDESRGGLQRGGVYARAIAPHLRPGAVLEIGVGTGAVALPLVEAGHAVVGVDLSPKMLAIAHGRLGARIALGDVMALPIATASVTNIVAVWVFQLVASVEQTMTEARRAIADEGRFLVVPSKAIHQPDEIDEVSVDFNAVLRGFRPDDTARLVALGEAAGFRLLAVTRRRPRAGTSRPPRSSSASSAATSASCSTSATPTGSASSCPRSTRCVACPTRHGLARDARNTISSCSKQSDYSAIAIACAVRSVCVSDSFHSVIPRSTARAAAFPTSFTAGAPSGPGPPRRRGS